jgi:protease-4
MSSPVPASGPTPGSDPSRAAYPPPPQKIVLEQPGGWFGRLGKVLWFALIVSLFFNFSQMATNQEYYQTGSSKIQERFYSGLESAKDKVAIIHVDGGIMETDGYIKHQIDRVTEDKDVKAVVLRINSPGGTVAASDYLYHHLIELRKKRDIPLVVSMGGICASGGYYMAMAVGDQKDCIFAEPATWTGSIGVIIPHYDVSNLLESWKIQDDSIASAKMKQMGSPTRKLTPEEREEERKVLQSLVDESFENFKDIVRKGRPALAQDDMKFDEITTGQVFTANQAKSHGMVDKIGYIEEAITRASEMASLPKEKVRVVEYKRPPSILDAFGGSAQAQGMAMPNFSLETLIDLTSPRAYYLSTWLPAILTNSK